MRAVISRPASTGKKKKKKKKVDTNPVAQQWRQVDKGVPT